MINWEGNKTAKMETTTCEFHVNNPSKTYAGCTCSTSFNLSGTPTKIGSDGKEHPVIPPLPKDEPNLDPNPIVSICGECGLELRQVMMYSCPSMRCPVTTKSTC